MFGGLQILPELHRHTTGRVPGLFFMEVNPPQKTVAKLKELAQQEGVSLNSYITPFLNDIAQGRLVRVPHYPVPKRDAA